VQAASHANKLPIDLINDNKVFSAEARQSLLDTLREPGASLSSPITFCEALARMVAMHGMDWRVADSTFVTQEPVAFIAAQEPDFYRSSIRRLFRELAEALTLLSSVESRREGVVSDIIYSLLNRVPAAIADNIRRTFGIGVDSTHMLVAADGGRPRLTVGVNVTLQAIERHILDTLVVAALGPADPKFDKALNTAYAGGAGSRPAPVIQGGAPPSLVLRSGPRPPISGPRPQVQRQGAPAAAPRAVGPAAAPRAVGPAAGAGRPPPRALVTYPLMNKTVAPAVSARYFGAPCGRAHGCAYLKEGSCTFKHTDKEYNDNGYKSPISK
jgi:hypothetical protein